MRAFAIFSSIVLMFITGLLPLGAHAQGTASEVQWSIVPVSDDNPATTAKGYFIYSMDAGSDVSGSVLLRNRSAIPVTIELAPVNAETSQQGGSAFGMEEKTPSGVAGGSNSVNNRQRSPPARSKRFPSACILQTM